MRQRRFHMTAWYALGIFALFLAGLLALVLLGAETYGKTVDSQRANSSRRALLSHISVTFRGYDREGAVSVTEGPEGDALMLVKEFDSGAFFTAFYLQDGKLMEEFGRDGNGFGAGTVQPIGECSSFAVQELGDQCYRLQVEDAELLLHQRSENGD